MIDATFVKEIVESAKYNAEPKIVEIDEWPYSHLTLQRIEPPMPDALGATTLSSIVTYLAKQPDQRVDLIVHVANYKQVRIVGSLDKYENRDELVTAHPVLETYRFGEWSTIDGFIISLMSLFEHTEHQDAILQLVSSLSDESVVAYDDDGVSQKVTATTGIARVGTIPVPRRVSLRPFRTFSEIEQPESEFIFRLRKDPARDIPQAALFEADGGAWKAECIERIVQWLTTNAPEGTTIIA